ncbi:MAG: DEAD/DEAH box helicase family protein [Anaerolineales bacterium]|nr:DEAD/DEAH box helicase family protein [Anaerolineales bacterium]
MSKPPFHALQFQYPFRKYQQMILTQVEQGWDKDRQHHLVAPPGAGKTIVGLELIRRRGRPAVVFCPTTTIQQQWHEKLKLFTEDDHWLQQNSSVEALELANITILTYQILSTPGENVEFVERLAHRKWVEELVQSGQVADEAAAEARIQELETANPSAARAEISKRYRRLKRTFLEDPEFDGRQFLHPNAVDLIDRLVALDVGVVVLDECHHLLDYWAFILRELIRELRDVHVVGLTATLPDPSNQREYENYNSLLGAVDFEVPTPAVVKEGNLAPYRDLVFFCQPTRRELAYLKGIQDHFTAAVTQVAATPLFRDWLLAQFGTGRADFQTFLNEQPFLCIASVKYLRAQGVGLPAGVTLIPEMREPLVVDDWLTLLEQFALRDLKVSPDKEKQKLYRELRNMLLGFGITITEAGIRHQRSPGDLVLALSEAKDGAAVRILQEEQAALGQRLRAVVITDYERMSAQTRRLKDILHPEAGSAVRVFRALITDPKTNGLDPILVTGKIVLVDADKQGLLDQGIHQWQAERRLDFTWEWRPTEDPRIVELTGSGKDWRSRTYVSLVTHLFELGLSQCLVGTRGIFGEGWDALSLNTLIDLTSVTTSTGVQQIRGRTIRLDPAWAKKVAHNWDVVCVSRDFDKGDADLHRFVAKHAHIWGVISQSQTSALAEAVMGGGPAGLPLRGRIVRGVAHVDLELTRDLIYKPFKKIEFNSVNKRMRRVIGDRQESYALWDIGGPYENFSFSATVLQAADIKFQSVYTLGENLRALLWRVIVAVLSVMVVVGSQALWAAFSISEGNLAYLILAAAVALPCGGLLGVAASIGSIIRLYRGTIGTIPVDLVLRDVSLALLAALRDRGKISQHLSPDYLRVVATEAGGFSVFVDYASPEDANTFARAIEELMGSLAGARYLVRQDSSKIGNPLLRMLWRLVRTVTGFKDPAAVYYRVPDILAARKEDATALASYWQRYVGGGELIYTRTDEGREVLLAARSQREFKPRQMAFEFWR